MADPCLRGRSTMLTIPFSLPRGALKVLPQGVMLRDADPVLEMEKLRPRSGRYPVSEDQGRGPPEAT